MSYLNYVPSLQSSTLPRINTLIGFFQEVRLCFGKSQFKEYHRLGASETLRTRLLSSQRSFNKYTFYDQKNVFWQNEYIFQKYLYFICNTNIICIKIYFSNEISVFLHFHSYFSLQKKLFSVKKVFNINFFFPYKNIFSAINVQFVTTIFFPKKIFVQLSFAKNEQP